MTDAEGRYELAELPPGRYTLFAAKDGFVALSYGQRSPSDSGRPIELAEGQTLEKVDFTLPRGSVISGRVVDENGEPMPDVAVSALQFRILHGKRRLVPVRQISRTNDIGQFRLFGLPPGNYYVSAAYRSPLSGSEDDLSGSHDSYAPIFYPGTPSASEAQPVTLRIGQESSVDFQLLPVKSVQVSGIVVDSSGRPMTRGMVSIREAGDSATAIPRGGALRADGTFVINAVPPGMYTLTAVGVASSAMGGPVFASASVAASSRQAATADPEVGKMSISVAEEDVNGLRLTASRGGVLRGRVTFEGGPAPVAAQPFRIACTPVDSDEQGPGGLVAPLQPDLTFAIRGVFGPCLVNAQIPNWTVKAVRQGGKDVTDDPIDATAGQAPAEVEIVVTNRQTTLAGSVSNEGGAPPTDYTVVAFPKDKARWRFPSPRIRTGRPDQHGLFKITGLPPGDYLVAAVQNLDEGGAQEPDVLTALEALAKPTSVRDGDTQAITLSIVALPQGQ